MFKRKKAQSHLEDTQPIDYKRLAKEVVKEQNQQKANRQGCTCLLSIVVVALVWVYLNSDQYAQSISVNPTVRPRVTAIPAQRALPTRTSLARVSTAVPTVAPLTAPSYLFHICANRLVNMRLGAGYSNYAIAGEMLPGRSYPVLAHVEGENVQGNTSWYQIVDGERTAYVTAYYTYVCDETAPALEPARDPAEQATVNYITTCEDRNLLAKARRASSEEVRRAEAMCMSKNIMIDLKAEFLGFILTPLQEAQSAMFDLICALRISGYAMTFDIYASGTNEYGTRQEVRAILARFEPHAVSQINCSGNHWDIKWEHIAETWWVHRSL